MNSVGTVTTNFGQASSITITRPNGANGLYLVTFSPAHPNGSAYGVLATPFTGSSGNSSRSATASVTSSSTFQVWIRHYDNTIIDSRFFAFTAP